MGTYRVEMDTRGHTGPHSHPAPTPLTKAAMPTPARIKAALFGDSGAYGAQGPGTDPVNERLAIPPVVTLNTAQSLFDFRYDYSRPGASWGKFFSPLQAQREAAGLPNGIEFADLLLGTDAQAILFCMGGIDHGNLADLPAGVRRAAGLCQRASKAYAFVGVPEIHATASFDYQPHGADFYASLNLQTTVAIASAAEMLRQTCLHEAYPFVDVRNAIRIRDWATVTGDMIHPTQAYSTAIFTRVARFIAGSP